MKITTITPLSIAILLSMAAAGAAQSSAGPAAGSARQAAQPPADTAAPAMPTAPATSPTSGSPRTTAPGSPAAGTTAGHAEVRSANTSPDYRLVPGDKLRIEVYRDAQLSQSLQIRPDGKITLPLVGDVPAEGRTATELRDALVTSLKEYNTNPVVTVIVVETVPPVFYVMGEVNSPGTFAIKGQVSAVQALAMAGGFKDFAKTKNIKILRKVANGAQENVKFNYKDAAEGKGPAVFMQPGDTIIVP
jgi:polysaccharide biosynthesis/export protein